MLALCFTALCLTADGQTPKPFFTKDGWRDYMAIGKKMAQLEAQVKSLSLDTVEKKGLTRLQGHAQKISSDEAHQAEDAADKNFVSKTEPLQKEMARLRSNQQELDMRYAMPAALPFTPMPAKKAKPWLPKSKCLKIDLQRFALTNGGHSVPQTHIRSRRTVGPESGGLADAGGKGCAEVKLQSDADGQRRTQQEESDSHEVSRSGICFHGSNLIRHRRRVLIERFH